jgi:hypothetical protein
MGYFHRDALVWRAKKGDMLPRAKVSYAHDLYRGATEVRTGCNIRILHIPYPVPRCPS